MAKWRQTVGLLVLTLATGTSLIACSESSTSPTTKPTSPSSGTSTTHVTTSTTATSSTTGVVASTTSTSVVTQSACRVGQLRIQAGAGGGATGNVGQTIVFTNVGQTPCTMSGYPGVAALDAQGS